MISGEGVSLERLGMPDAALHSYGTAEDLPVEFPSFQPSGEWIEGYRVAWGLYCTGESGQWILSPESLKQFFQVQSRNLPLQVIFQMLTLDAATPLLVPEGKKQVGFLLSRIQARRAKIEARAGILRESYPLIREDREK